MPPTDSHAANPQNSPMVLAAMASTACSCSRPRRLSQSSFQLSAVVSPWTATPYSGNYGMCSGKWEIIVATADLGAFAKKRNEGDDDGLAP